MPNPYEAPEHSAPPQDPGPAPLPPKIGGWLILVGFGVVISPIRLLAGVLSDFLPIFTEGTWEALTDPSSPTYNSFWAPILIGEIIYNAAMIVATLYLAYLFFSRHFRFPTTYIAVVAASLLFIPLDAWLVSLVQPDEPVFDPATVTLLVRTLIGAMIWVPYMLVSKRVKETFVIAAPTGVES